MSALPDAVAGPHVRALPEGGGRAHFMQPARKVASRLRPPGDMDQHGHSHQQRIGPHYLVAGLIDLAITPNGKTVCALNAPTASPAAQ
jgi:hypothetical protein